MSKSLYAVLNVAPDADPAVVEAAYKALIKKYHPDVKTDDPVTARRRAAEINEAFQVLKDPSKREQYDSNERARTEAIRRNAIAMAEGPRPYAPPPAPRRRRSKWPALFTLLVGAAAVFLIWRGSEAFGERARVEPLSFGASNKAGSPLAPIRQEDVQRAVDEFERIKDRSGLLGLSAYSRDCFGGQTRWETVSEFDYCVAFDKAAVTYSAALLGHDYLPQLPRFESKEVRTRHSSAGKLLSSDEDMIQTRIDQLGGLTARRLAALASAEATTTAGATAILAKQPHAKLQAQRHAQRKRPVRTTRYNRPRRQQRPGAARANPDFLEREGYIY